MRKNSRFCVLFSNNYLHNGILRFCIRTQITSKIPTNIRKNCVLSMINIIYYLLIFEGFEKRAKLTKKISVWVSLNESARNGCLMTLLKKWEDLVLLTIAFFYVIIVPWKLRHIGVLHANHGNNSRKAYLRGEKANACCSFKRSAFVFCLTRAYTHVRSGTRDSHRKRCPRCLAVFEK